VYSYRQLKIAHWLCSKIPKIDFSCAALLHFQLSVLLTMLSVASIAHGGCERRSNEYEAFVEMIQAG